MAQLVMGAFAQPGAANQAIYELEHFGYQPQDISVISKTDKYESQGYGSGDEIARGAASGATTGAAIGGLAGLFAGIGVFPALTGLFVAGPIGAALGLTGAVATTVAGAATGAMAGGLIGALMNLGLNQETAEIYNRTVEAGGIVVGVSASGLDDNRAREILDKHGANEITTINLKQPLGSDSRTRERLNQQPVFGETREGADIVDDTETL